MANIGALIVDENINVRINGLRASLSLLAAVALIALFAHPGFRLSSRQRRLEGTRDLRVDPMQGTPSAVAFRATSSNLCRRVIPRFRGSSRRPGANVSGLARISLPPGDIENVSQAAR